MRRRGRNAGRGRAGRGRPAWGPAALAGSLLTVLAGLLLVTLTLPLPLRAGPGGQPAEPPEGLPEGVQTAPPGGAPGAYGAYEVAPCARPAAEGTWRRVEGDGPPPRSLHVAVFDPRRGEALFYGGVGRDYTVLADLWAFDVGAERWREVTTGGEGPSPRWAAAALHDSPRDRMVLLFGNAAPATDEVWTLDLGTRRWERLPPGYAGPAPVARYDAAAATDGGDRAWAFGGFAGPQFRPDTALNDLWELDLAGGAWRPLAPGGTPPPPTTNAGLAYHQDALYLVGGHDAYGVTPGYWRYDLTLQEWRALPALQRPAAWTHHARAVDSACGALLLLGGDDADDVAVPFLEAFVMGAGYGIERLPGVVDGVSRHHGAMAFDPTGRRLVLFGGWRGRQDFLEDTWTYGLNPEGAP